MAWYALASRSQWRSPSDIKEAYRNASFTANNRVVFNIKGNDYRLVVAVAYRFGAVYVKFIGEHAEYDRVDAATVEIP
jgi:mRNA interferase HigB